MNNSTKNKELVLFFTRGVSFHTWMSSGLADRELKVYETLLAKGVFDFVTLITYGCEDRKIFNKYKSKFSIDYKIRLVEMPKIFTILPLGVFFYMIFIPIIHKNVIKDASLLKSNQIDGSISVILSARIFIKKSFIRSGYSYSFFTKNLFPKSSVRNFYARFSEWVCYRFGDFGSVSSQWEFELLTQSRSNLCPLEIIPNYVDTIRFKDLSLQRSDRLVFVGRITQQKNLFAGVTAAANAGVGIDVVGNGEDFEALRTYCRVRSLDVRFFGVVMHDEIPQLLNQYKFFFLPSYFEGMPKALLEAMSCGCIPIAVDAVGMNEVIKNEYNGFLAQSACVAHLESAIRKAVSCQFKLLSPRCVQEINSRYSLDTIVQKEINLINKYGY